MWKRKAPGQYELYDDEGVLCGIIERSAMMPWRWWWSVWSESVCATNDASGLRAAKRAAFVALESKVESR